MEGFCGLAATCFLILAGLAWFDGPVPDGVPRLLALAVALGGAVLFAVLGIVADRLTPAPPQTFPEDTDA